jgi:hypothetical protein
METVKRHLKNYKKNIGPFKCCVEAWDSGMFVFTLGCWIVGGDDISYEEKLITKEIRRRNYEWLKANYADAYDDARSQREIQVGADNICSERVGKPTFISIELTNFLNDKMDKDAAEDYIDMMCELMYDIGLKYYFDRKSCANWINE